MNELAALHERAKELRCLYAIDAVVAERNLTPAEAFSRVLREIPPGWQRPATTGARIDYLGRPYVGPGFVSDGKTMSEPIRLWGNEVGHITVSDHGPPSDSSEPFLVEEAELLRRIAGRLGEYLEWKHTELLGERGPATRDHWAWRQRFADALADAVDPDRFGVSRLFIGGSTARGDAGPGSDIDLYVEHRGSAEQRRELGAWLEGWSACLAEVALQQTGHPFPGGILNVHWLDQGPSVWQGAELQELALRHSQR